MDALFEIFIEIFAELTFLIVPEKNISRGCKILLKLLAVFMFLVYIVLFLWGFVLIFDYGRLIGILPVGIAAVFSISQIVVGIVLYNKNH